MSPWIIPAAFAGLITAVTAGAEVRKRRRDRAWAAAAGQTIRGEGLAWIEHLLAIDEQLTTRAEEVAMLERWFAAEPAREDERDS